MRATWKGSITKWRAEGTANEQEVSRVRGVRSTSLKGSEHSFGKDDDNLTAPIVILSQNPFTIYSPVTHAQPWRKRLQLRALTVCYGLKTHNL